MNLLQASASREIAAFDRVGGASYPVANSAQILHIAWV
jgi:hypothetical protein